MIQLARAILISMLVGVFASGLCWLFWDLILKVKELKATWGHEEKLRDDSEALMDQAKDKKA